TRVPDVIDLAARLAAGRADADVVDRLIPPLVNVADAEAHARAQFVIETERVLVLLRRLEVRVDLADRAARFVRGVAEVDRLDELAAVAAVLGVRTLAVKRLPVEAVERVVIADPLFAAPRAARQLELHGVEEQAVRSVRLPLAVALDVVGEAGTRRNLVAPP